MCPGYFWGVLGVVQAVPGKGQVCFRGSWCFLGCPAATRSGQTGPWHGRFCRQLAQAGRAGRAAGFHSSEVCCVLFAVFLLAACFWGFCSEWFLHH